MRLDQEIKYREARAREDGHAAGLSEGSGIQRRKILQLTLKLQV